LKKRDNLEIIAEILRIARYGANKTRIVYGGNLNFKILKQYLGELKKNGLIKNEEGILHTTKKGIEYLKHYSGFKNFLNVHY
jgi:predicted transcriptional regulator